MKKIIIFLILILFSINVNAVINILPSCDSIVNICDMYNYNGSFGNSTSEMIIAVNTTGLLRNWSGTLDTNTYNTTQQMINAVNTTGYLRNWSYVDTNTWNTSRQMVIAVNNTALNMSKSVGYYWTKLIGRLITSVSSKWFTTPSGVLTFDEVKLNSTIDARDTDTNTYNTTAQMITAVNTTGYLRNWSYVDTDTDTYNTTAQMITAVNSTGLLINWNASGYIINWSKVIIDTNDTAKVNALISSNITTNLRITTINNTLILKTDTINSTINTRINNLKLGNTSIEIINAVNGTALNGTNFKSIQWNNVVGKVINWVDILSKPFNTLSSWFEVKSNVLYINETKLNATIRTLDTNETTRVNALYSSNITTNARINTLNSTKLNIIDQRYNDTTLILNVNATTNTRITDNYNTFVSSNTTVTNKITAVNSSLQTLYARELADNTTQGNYIKGLQASNISTNLRIDGLVSSNTTTNTRITDNYNTFVASNTTVTNKINAVNSSSVTNLNNFKTTVAKDYFNLSQDETVTGNIIFNPSTNTSFYNDVLVYNNMYIYGNTTLTDVNGMSVNGTIIYKDIDGITKITINASNPLYKILVDGNIFVSGTVYASWNGSINSQLLLNDSSLQAQINNIDKNGNSTNEMITAVNTTGYLINWNIPIQKINSSLQTLYTRQSNDNTTQANYIKGLQVSNTSTNTRITDNYNTFISSNSTLTSVINLKLDITDQRYNDTAKINAVNTSSNIKSLGFNLTTELKTYFDTLYYGITNSNNYVSLSTVVASIGNWTQDKVNYYTKTQVYNKTETYTKTEVNGLPISTFSNDALYLTSVPQSFNQTTLVLGINETTNTRIDNLKLGNTTTEIRNTVRNINLTLKSLNITSGATNFRFYIDTGGNLIIG